ncbi:MAG: CapA family protein [Proteiniphilum sp.]|jgi:poly-gamma-glutamate synthesis protein (capsule biosynthesis protein)|nr:CapA family protein [Proteiniphilum sp.]
MKVIRQTAPSAQNYRPSCNLFTGIVIHLLLGLSSCHSPRAQTVDIPVREDSLTVVRVIVAGDAMAHGPQITRAKNPQTGEYDFSGCFRYLEDILAEGDLTIVNLETTLAGAPYTGYPQFCAPDSFALALRDAGFNFFLLANNHSADKGAKGVRRTVEKLREMKVPTAGTYLDGEDRMARYPAMVEINGIKIALLNYTYGTNGLSVAPPLSVNNLNDTAQIGADIETARAKCADIIVAFPHWGTEYKRYPDKRQKEQAAFLFRRGVDVIIGSHPHVVQPVEYFACHDGDTAKVKPVCWSLGNLISNQRKEHTDGGMLASFRIVKNKNSQSTSVENFETIPCWVYRDRDTYPGYFVLPVDRFQEDTATFTFSAEDKATFERFARNTKELLGKTR